MWLVPSKPLPLPRAVAPGGKRAAQQQQPHPHDALFEEFACASARRAQYVAARAALLASKKLHAAMNDEVEHLLNGSRTESPPPHLPPPFADMEVGFSYAQPVAQETARLRALGARFEAARAAATEALAKQKELNAQLEMQLRLLRDIARFFKTELCVFGNA